MDLKHRHTPWIVIVLTLCLLVAQGIALAQSNTVYFMTVADPYVGAIRQLLPEFEKETGIKVVIDSVPFPNLQEKALLELASGRGSYDLISVDMPWIGQFVESGHVLDITDLVQRDREELDIADILPGAWEALALWNDRVIGLPLAPYYMYVHYRTDLFEKAGITKLPETAAEFLDVAKAINDPGNEFYGVSLAMKRGPSSITDWAAYYNGFGGRIFVDPPNNYATAINGEIGIFTTKWLKELSQYAPPGVLQYENIDRWNAFMHGKAGMVAVFNANSPQFETADDSQVQGRVGYFHFPKINASDPGSMPFGGFTLVINKHSRNVEAAWTFMKWLMSKEFDREWVQVPGTPGVPRRLSVVSDPELLAKYPYFQLIYDAEHSGLADGVHYRSRLPEWVQIEDVLGLELNLAFTGEKLVEDALSDAAERINEIMKKAGYPVNPEY